ncbi:hypothetical protein DICVIV_13660 [Dictyocaulus viviparus]|uniref:Exonuclease domain-containing protein n=1 Tax=Dictyocaulus viviparus TaxID=29172 RepID=A0A0D8X9D8_DICVI|nr:hypothetical protein DICVIV_13660 [Dictyocaulus viviparus]
MKESVLTDFYEAPQPMTAYDPRSSSFYAMDCEFVYTTWGKAPARITVVDQYGADVIDCVFHPDHDLVDPNTQYSGLSEEEIEGSRMTLREQQITNVGFCVSHFLIDYTNYNEIAHTSGMMSYPCCGKPLGVAGCSYSNSHVTDTMKESVLTDFYEAPQPMTAYDPRSSSFYAMDCEFVYTTWGKEPARITVVDQYGADVIDCVFHPDHDLVDPNTQYSGLSEEEIEESRMTLREVNAFCYVFESVTCTKLMAVVVLQCVAYH